MRKSLIVLASLFLPLQASAFDRARVPARAEAVDRAVVERVAVERGTELAFNVTLDAPIGAVILPQPAATVDSAAAPTLAAPDTDLAPTLLPPEEDIGAVIGLISQLIAAVNAKNYQVAVAIGLMLAVFVVRKFFLKQVPEESTKWAVLGLAVVLKVSTGVYGGEAPLEAVLAGIGTALMTVGAWEFGKPKLAKKPVGKPKLKAT